MNVVANTNGTLTGIELRTNDGTVVSGGNIAIDAGFEEWVTAYGEYDNSGTYEDNINAKVSFSSSDTRVAYVLDTFDTNVRARSDGSAVISAKWQGQTATVTADINGLNSIDIHEGCADDAAASPIIDGGNPLDLNSSGVSPQSECINAWGNYASGSKVRLTTVVWWSSNDRDIATMSLLQRNSEVSAVRGVNDSTTVSAKLVGIEGTAPVNVTP